MNIVDLTHYINEDMTVYPGTEKPKIKKANTLEKDGFRESKLTMYSHVGTHIDAPAHMLEKSSYLDELHIGRFIGRATILDFTSKLKIELKDIKLYEEEIKNSEFIIIKTGWEKYWGEDKYFKGFPTMDEECVNWISKFNLKGIGVDAISIDSVDSEEFIVHKTILSKNIISIENLCNLDSVKSKYFTLSVLPLKLSEADGSPVRAIAIE